MLTIYACFVTPMVLVYPHFEDGLKGFELQVDILFTIDIFLNFFKLDDGEDSNKLKDNA
jgi:hypothetical protein